MKPLNTTELLQVWETGLNQTVIEKSLCLLSAACAVPVDEVALMSIGERDARLLSLREWMFGTRFNNIASCPNCLQTVEWEMDVEEIHLQTPPATPGIKEYNLEADGFNLNFRLPNSIDIIKASFNNGNPEKLLAGCILKVQHAQQDYEVADLPGAVFEALSKRMETEDPQADIQMLINCPDCSHRWQAPFDIVSYLWTEIDYWARHMLQEVCVLASAFGWPEYEILSMSPRRRQLYLEMLQS